MFERLFGVKGTFSGSKRGDQLLIANNIIKKAVIAYKIVGDEQFAALGEIVMDARSQLADKSINDENAERYALVVNTFGKQLANLAAAHGLKERIEAALVVPHGSPSMSRLAVAEKNLLSQRSVIAATIVANDIARKIWSDAEVFSEQSRFGFARTPSLNDAYEKYGK
jgi:hypothetical protein